MSESWLLRWEDLLYQGGDLCTALEPERGLGLVELPIRGEPKNPGLSRWPGMRRTTTGRSSPIPLASQPSPWVPAPAPIECGENYHPLDAATITASPETARCFCRRYGSC